MTADFSHLALRAQIERRAARRAFVCGTVLTAAFSVAIGWLSWVLP